MQTSSAEVEEMKIELEAKKETVAISQKDCEEMLVTIVAEKRVADEQARQVTADSERIGKEEAETTRIAEDCQADLDKALPVFEKAMIEVDKLDKGSISEVKNYKTPPAPVVMVLGAVMTIFGKPTDWDSRRRRSQKQTSGPR